MKRTIRYSPNCRHLSMRHINALHEILSMRGEPSDVYVEDAAHEPRPSKESPVDRNAPWYCAAVVIGESLGWDGWLVAEEARARLNYWKAAGKKVALVGMPRRLLPKDVADAADFIIY